ncbi:hypothetical protein, partial [Rhodococcus sp. BS-15]|uniref:hypothetical protein n=1 Tax=Rhodococcus sp. BS-15 TaxID=1304954 RepID=UPI0016512E1F
HRDVAVARRGDALIPQLVQETLTAVIDLTFRRPREIVRDGLRLLRRRGGRLTRARGRRSGGGGLGSRRRRTRLGRRLGGEVVLVGAPVAVESSLPQATSIELAATANTPSDRVLVRELRIIDRNPSVVGFAGETTAALCENSELLSAGSTARSWQRRPSA